MMAANLNLLPEIGGERVKISVRRSAFNRATTVTVEVPEKNNPTIATMLEDVGPLISIALSSTMTTDQMLAGVRYRWDDQGKFGIPSLVGDLISNICEKIQRGEVVYGD